MHRYPKLNAEQRRQLSEDLHRRMELLRELAMLGMKQLAARYGCHHQTVLRMDWQMHGYHIPSPTGISRPKYASPC